MTTTSTDTLTAAAQRHLWMHFTQMAADGDVQWLGVGGKFWLGIGAIAIGIPIMIIWNLVNRSYFKGGTMVSSDELVAEAEAA